LGLTCSIGTLNSQPIGLALRSFLYRPSEIIQFSKIADEANVEAIFFPDIPRLYDSLTLSSYAFASTKKIRIGSGVLRPLEHGLVELTRTVATLQFVSDNRFILGVGTGNPGQNPHETIEKMLDMVRELRLSLQNVSPDIVPPTYVATLRVGIARRVIQIADGLILNFCSPQYCSKIVSGLRSETELNKKRIACYVKIFYSKKIETARRLLIEEFANYDQIPTYHKMFERDDIAKDIAQAKANIEMIVQSGRLPSSLLSISLVNPSSDELKGIVQKFRDGGVDLPVIYPYFSPDTETSFKREIMSSIVSM
jgi:alkanesulfonate monooxygenase SsuD/methylene tetrahydromethanopterin reductase-like flavin-dependent oxidoreductase (luciferase family)